MASNLSSPLCNRRLRDPMRDYDRLPPELRQWLAQAALPWSPQSAKRIWHRAGGGRSALDKLAAAEAATLQKEERQNQSLRKAIRA